MVDFCRVLPFSRRNISKFGQYRPECRIIYRLNVRFAFNGIFLHQTLRSRRPWLKSAAAVRAYIKENILYTLTTKRAFKRAYHRLVAVVWQLTAAVFANRSDLEHNSYFIFFAGVSRPP